MIYFQYPQSSHLVFILSMQSHKPFLNNNHNFLTILILILLCGAHTCGYQMMHINNNIIFCIFEITIEIFKRNFFYHICICMWGFFPFLLIMNFCVNVAGDNDKQSSFSVALKCEGGKKKIVLATLSAECFDVDLLLQVLCIIALTFSLFLTLFNG